MTRTGRYKVVLTRDSDVYLKLHERVARARAAHGDLFISLHADSAVTDRSTRGASIYTRVLLMPIHDATGGFKCFRRTVLESIDLESIDAAGYVFQIETTYRALRKGFRIVEVPIRFVDRTVGESKMSRAIVLEAIWKVPELRLRALRGRL